MALLETEQLEIALFFVLSFDTTLVSRFLTKIATTNKSSAEESHSTRLNSLDILSFDPLCLRLPEWIDMSVVDVVGERVEVEERRVEGGGNLQLLIRTTCHSDSCRFIIIFTYSNFKSWAALQLFYLACCILFPTAVSWNVFIYQTVIILINFIKMYV